MAYPDVALGCGFEGYGFVARQRKPGGAILAEAMTLDEVAELIDAQK